MPGGSPSGTAEWRAVVSVGPIRYGDVVPVPDSSKIVPPFGITVALTGEVVPCELVEPAGLVAFFDRSVKGDARVLPIRTVGSRRHRTWPDIQAAMGQEAFSDWPLPGPEETRSTRWCVEYLVREEENIERHHERFKLLVKADAWSWGIQEHHSAAQTIKYLAEYDQLDICNSAGCELLFRRMQTIEFGYLETLRESEAKAAGGAASSRLTLEEQTLLSGAARSSGSLMIAPQLLEHARKETEREAGLLKNLQKVREGREALRKKKP